MSVTEQVLEDTSKMTAQEKKDRANEKLRLNHAARKGSNLEKSMDPYGINVSAESRRTFTMKFIKDIGKRYRAECEKFQETGEFPRGMLVNDEADRMLGGMIAWGEEKTMINSDGKKVKACPRPIRIIVDDNVVGTRNLKYPAFKFVY